MRKKVLSIIVIIILILAVIGGYRVISIINSPEYALIGIMADVKNSGIDGLKPHLTGEAKELVDKTDEISSNYILNSIISTLDIDKYIDILKSELSEIEWGIDEVLRNKNKADVYLNFNYKDKLTGTIEIKMLYEEHEWKITKIELPQFDEVKW